MSIENLLEIKKEELINKRVYSDTTDLYKKIGFTPSQWSNRRKSFLNKIKEVKLFLSYFQLDINVVDINSRKDEQLELIIAESIKSFKEKQEVSDEEIRLFVKEYLK